MARKVYAAYRPGDIARARAIGMKVRQLRTGGGTTLKSLARFAKIEKRDLVLIEKGRVYPCTWVLFKFDEYFGGYGFSRLTKK